MARNARNKQLLLSLSRFELRLAYLVAEVLVRAHGIAADHAVFMRHNICHPITINGFRRESK